MPLDALNYFLVVWLSCYDSCLYVCPVRPPNIQKRHARFEYGVNIAQGMSKFRLRHSKVSDKVAWCSVQLG